MVNIKHCQLLYSWPVIFRKEKENENEKKKKTEKIPNPTDLHMTLI